MNATHPINAPVPSALLKLLIDFERDPEAKSRIITRKRTGFESYNFEMNGDGAPIKVSEVLANKISALDAALRSYVLTETNEFLEPRARQLTRAGFETTHFVSPSMGAKFGAYVRLKDGWYVLV